MNPIQNVKQNRSVAWWTVLIFSTVSLILHTFDIACAVQESDEEKIQYLKSLDLEALTNLEVTSVSKKTEKLSDAAAAIFVITAEDIRRTGVTNIPEALRMVPGLQVAHIDANKWVVTARGFGGSFANKLLVMIDGRTVYSPLWSGVFWNVQDTMLEDIERIEVIRGPGASLWGANAVNGIINIITKKAIDTLGGLVSGGVGTEERAFASLRYGLETSDNAHLRFYAKYFDRDAGAETDGSAGNDDWSGLRGGFRFDWESSADNAFTFQGDAYSQSTGVTYEFASLTPPDYFDTVLDDTEQSGGNLLGRWKHSTSDLSDLALQVYFDHTRTKDQLIEEVRNTFDIDFQHRFATLPRNEIIWGLGYRTTRDQTEDLRNTRFDPRDRTLDLYSIFIQDQITVLPERFWLTIGSKFEYNTYTGWEVQPTGRFLWKPRTSHSFWGAVSRAVRTPSRAERDVLFHLATLPPGSPENPGPLPVQVRVNGSDLFESEEVLAFELGYRFLVNDRMGWDFAAFYNKYDKIYSSVSGPPVFTPGPPPSVVVTETITNDQKIDSRGLEVALNLIPNHWWKVDVAYTYLKLDQELGENEISGSSPENQISIRSAMDLPKNLELDLWARYVSNLPALDVDEYFTFDARLGWKPISDLDISLVGQNLAADQHLEFIDQFLPARSTEVERGVYVKVTWIF